MDEKSQSIRISLTLRAECIVAYHTHHIANNRFRKICHCWQCEMVREMANSDSAKAELLRLFVAIENGSSVGEIADCIRLDGNGRLDRSAKGIRD